MRLLRMKSYIKRWDPEIFAKLPDHYRRFLDEARKPPTPVHYVPEMNKHWEKDPKTGKVKRFQDCRIPLLYPKEYDMGLWGGEAIIKGFMKKTKKHRWPKYHVPTLLRNAVYSEILDQYLSVVLTHRTLRQIDEHYGFDSYILRTPLADLGSQLAFDLRRMMLLALARKSMYPEDPVKRRKILDKYKDCIIPEEEAEWFGLRLDIAMERALEEDAIVNAPKPLKIQLRQELFESLKEWKEENPDEALEESRSWISKLNPFGKRA